MFENLSFFVAPLLSYLPAISMVCFFAVTLFASRKWVYPMIIRRSQREGAFFLKLFVKSRALNILPHLACALVSLGALYKVDRSFLLNKVLFLGAEVYVVAATTLLLYRFNQLVGMYIRKAGESLSTRPTKSYTDFISILIFLGGGVVSICVLLEVSPVYFLGSLGAVTAFLVVVFKDPLLSLIASIQISFNDIIRRGDYIKIDSLNVEGEVLDITLSFVKVLNEDDTVTTFPTRLISEVAVKNWNPKSS